MPLQQPILRSSHSQELPLEEVRAEMGSLFQSLHPEETTFYVSPAMVLAWCSNKRSCYVYIANQLHTAQRVDGHARGVAFCWADQHMYLYESTSWCAHSASRGVKAPAALKLPCSKRADIPLARAWGVLQDGEAPTAGTYGC